MKEKKDMKADLVENHTNSLKEECVNSDYSLRVVSYRGIHYDPCYFSKEKRHQSVQDKSVGKTTLSYATFKESGYDADDEIEESNPKLIKAHEKMHSFFYALKNSNDKQELKETSRNKKKFKTFFYRFIQAYVENYGTLFNEGTIKTDFGFPSKDNPAISTSYLADKAMKYASGMRNKKGTEEHRFSPHYRRYTGKPKHPNVGYIDAFSFDLPYVNQNGHHILELIKQGKINISHIKQFECEILFESMIPGKYHIFKEIFSFPPFHLTYQEHYLSKYGLTKIMYNKFRERIINFEESTNSEEMLTLLNELIESMVENKAIHIRQKIENQLYSNHHQHMVFPYYDWEITAEPISPHNKESWRKVEIEYSDMSQINDAFGDLVVSPKKIFS